VTPGHLDDLRIEFVEPQFVAGTPGAERPMAAFFPGR